MSEEEKFKERINKEQYTHKDNMRKGIFKLIVGVGTIFGLLPVLLSYISINYTTYPCYYGKSLLFVLVGVGITNYFTRIKQKRKDLEKKVEQLENDTKELNIRFDLIKKTKE